jgi:glycine cleavage system H protein
MDAVRFTDRHQWVRREEGDIGVVGITEFAQQQLSEVTYVELPDVGERLAADEELGSIESSKTVSDLFAPVAGEVIEVNAAIAEDPAPVNEDPMGSGWLLRLRMDDPSTLEDLLTADEYAERYG